MWKGLHLFKITKKISHNSFYHIKYIYKLWCVSDLAVGFHLCQTHSETKLWQALSAFCSHSIQLESPARLLVSKSANCFRQVIMCQSRYAVRGNLGFFTQLFYFGMVQFKLSQHLWCYRMEAIRSVRQMGGLFQPRGALCSAHTLDKCQNESEYDQSIPVHFTDGLFIYTTNNSGHLQR